MLKVYISADIEGINGVVYPRQTNKIGGDDYFRARKQQIIELNHLIQSILEIGAYHITLNDAHASMDNIDILELHPQVELITGKPKAISMMHGLNESYSCVVFAGYHSMAGTQSGVLSHTFSTIFNKVCLNGEEIGEIGLNAIYAGLKNVPVAFLYGDESACIEANRFIGNLQTVSSKKACSTTSAICKPNAKFFEELKFSIQNSLKNHKTWVLKKSLPTYKLNIGFANREFTDAATLLPCIEKVSPFEISYKSDNFEDVYKLLQFLSFALVGNTF